jgi:phosphoribosylformylglycinamidine synthase PurS subunit
MAAIGRWERETAWSLEPETNRPEPGARSLEPDEMKARVFVTLKPSVFDPQGHTITEALHQMGYAGVGDVRQGKYFELDVEATSPEQAHTLASEVAHKLLANPVIESYRVEVA